LPIIKIYKAYLIYCYTKVNKASYKLNLLSGGSDKSTIIGDSMLGASDITIFTVAGTANDILAMVRCDSESATVK